MKKTQKGLHPEKGLHPAKGLFLVVLMTVPGLAMAGTMTGGATMPEQIVQEATLIQSKVTEAQQLVNMIQRYENMIQNMVTLPQTMLNKVMQPVDQLYGLAQQAEALGTAGQNISSQFQNLHVQFSPQLTADYTQKYSSITSGLDKAIDTALKTANINPENFLKQGQAMNAIQSAMQNPNSRNAIMQASVTVGQAEVSDLTQMAQTANSEENMQAAYLKKKTLRDAAAHEDNQEVQQAMWGTAPVTPPTFGASPLSNMQPIG